MKIAVVSASLDPDITLALQETICAAVEDQLMLHYAPFCQSAGATVRPYTSVEAVPNDGQTGILLIVDKPDDSEALGWHAVVTGGRAYGRIFWDELKGVGATTAMGPLSLSCTISHECLEMVGNPYVNTWVDMQDPANPGVLEAAELCDRTQADAYVVDGTGVTVSNFLGPRAFRSGDGPYDYMQLLGSAWEIRPGGYAIRSRNGVATNVWGEDVPEWRRLQKQGTERNRRARNLGDRILS